MVPGYLLREVPSLFFKIYRNYITRKDHLSTFYLDLYLYPVSCKTSSTTMNILYMIMIMILKLKTCSMCVMYTHTHDMYMNVCQYVMYVCSMYVKFMCAIKLLPPKNQPHLAVALKILDLHRSSELVYC